MRKQPKAGPKPVPAEIFPDPDPRSPWGKADPKRCNRERLTIELIYAARALAASLVQKQRVEQLVGDPLIAIFKCRSCGVQIAGAREMLHKPSCKVGRVVQVLLALEQTTPRDKGVEVADPDAEIGVDVPGVGCVTLQGIQVLRNAGVLTSKETEEARRSLTPAEIFRGRVAEKGGRK